MSVMPTWEEFNAPVLTVLSDGTTRHTPRVTT